MAELTVAGTYAKALFDVAKEAGKIELIEEELDSLKSIFEKEQDFQRLIESPTISVKEKKDVLQKVFEGKMEEELLNFLYILVDKGRSNQIERIIRKYKDEVAEFKNFSNGTIYSAAPLKKEKVAEFEEQVSKLLSKKVKLENQIDEKLIGGVKILVEGKVIDASVKQELSDLLKKLQN
ncbi:MAG: F0F1 ATP synthase subunit delta [Clostridia bacterium]|nr:F0F1 ATP synthase subunit delta [Clostridia bacterium]